MVSATFASTIDQPWLHLPPLNLGDETIRGGEPNRYVLIETDSGRLRCDIRDSEHSMFEDAQVWRGLLIIGYGARLHCIDLATRSVKTHVLEWYFQGILKSDDYCLVSSAQQLLRINPDGSIRWMVPHVGLDGVIVDSVEEGIVSGQGDWDPPGGWRPFKVSLSSGEMLKAG